MAAQPPTAAPLAPGAAETGPIDDGLTPEERAAREAEEQAARERIAGELDEVRALAAAEEQRLVAEAERERAEQAAADRDEQLRVAAEANATWIEQVWEAARPDVLTFLRFRPSRELRDVLDAARRLTLPNAAVILGDALSLAANHTGDPSPCPTGYAALHYLPAEEDVAKVLALVADDLRRTRLPGKNLGWGWDVDVVVDTTGRRVTASFVASPPGT